MLHVFLLFLGPILQKRAIVIVNIYYEQKCASQINHNLMIIDNSGDTEIDKAVDEIEKQLLETGDPINGECHDVKL